MASNESGVGQQDAEIDFGIDQPVRGNSSGQGTASLPSTGQIKDQARKAAGQAKQAATDAMGQATATAQQAKEQVGQKATEAARMLREKGTSFLSDQKTRATTTLEDLGNAIHDAGTRLEKDNDNAIAGYVHGAADQVRVLSTYLKDKPVESLFTDACNLARRKPEYFVGGMFIAGLALARFAKSAAVQTPSGSSRQWYETGSDPYATSPRLPMPGHDAASGGHEIVNPYAVPYTGTTNSETSSDIGSTGTSSQSGVAQPVKGLGTNTL